MAAPIFLLASERKPGELPAAVRTIQLCLSAIVAQAITGELSPRACAEMANSLNGVLLRLSEVQDVVRACSEVTQPDQSPDWVAEQRAKLDRVARS